MTINKTENGNELILALSGRLDTVTAPSLEAEISCIPNITTLILDLSELDYTSSAGLRVLLVAQKRMNNNGKMIIRNVSPSVMEVFDITGFSDILTIE